MKIDRSLETTRNEVHHSAVAGSMSVFATQDRATVAMACGTGKTLVELGVAEALLAGGAGPKRILMQVPTLALIKQAREDWAEQQEFGDRYDSMCICSDKKIKGDDSFSLSDDELEELGLSKKAPPVEQEVARINAWLDAREAADPNAVSVIFTTYPSVSIVGRAFRESGREFDLGVFDEAHKTAGMAEKETTFGYALQDSNIKIKKRLFGTATPRVRVRDSDKDGHDPKFLSMDNPAIYGPKAYEISFREAAEKGIIVPFKVIISIINDDNIKPEDLDTIVHDSHRRPIDARTVANMAALQRAMDSLGLKKAITFHNTIDAAEDFATVQHSVNGATLGDFRRLHVSGAQNGNVRDAVMAAYADKDAKSVISNAKCLTEGLNVPATDLVAFMESKTSKVDIVQAVGRTLRKYEGKDTGYVFLPLHVSRKQGETYEAAFERSIVDFEQISFVLKALADSDTVLESQLKKIGYAKRRPKSEDSDGCSLFEGIPIEFVHDRFFQLDPDSLVRAISTEVVEWLTSDRDAQWMNQFDALNTFIAIYGRYPSAKSKDDGERKLGQWVRTQRQSKDTLAESQPERYDLLNGIEFDWGLSQDAFNAQWVKQFEVFKAFVATYDRYPSMKSENDAEKRLGEWVGTQRKSKSSLMESQPDRYDLLASFGFAWASSNVRQERRSESFDAAMLLVKRTREKSRSNKDGGQASGDPIEQAPELERPRMRG